MSDVILVLNAGSTSLKFTEFLIGDSCSTGWNATRVTRMLLRSIIGSCAAAVREAVCR